MVELKEPKDPVFVNYLGEIPINPDDLPERKLIVGPGTDRPVAFTFDRLFYYYWNVRFFRFAFGGYLPPRDQVADFLGAGGASGGIGGATAGLGAVAIDASMPSAFTSAGNTQIKMVSRVKNRIKDQRNQNDNYLDNVDFDDLDNINLAQKPNPAKKIPGDPDGPYAEQILHIRRNKNNGKEGIEYRPIEVGEGSLAAAGPVHVGFNQGSGVIVDFSSIIYFRRLYWPKIIVFTPWGLSFLAYSSEYETEYEYKPPGFSLGYDGLSSYYANVTFAGGIIPIFYAKSLQVGQTGLRGIIGPIINGAITHNIIAQHDCCSRFYYDNSDEYRLAQAGECKSCEEQGVGLKAQ